MRDMLIFSKGGVVLDAELPVFQLVSLFQAKADDYSQAKKEFGKRENDEAKMLTFILTLMFVNFFLDQAIYVLWIYETMTGTLTQFEVSILMVSGFYVNLNKGSPLLIFMLYLL